MTEFDAFRMNVKYYREIKHISQIQLASCCDCSPGTIGSIEAGKTKPSFDMLVKIAHSLGVHPADLFLRNSSFSAARIRGFLISRFDAILKEI